MKIKNKAIVRHYTVGNYKNHGRRGTGDSFIWIRNKQNYESLASALLMKKLLAPDINLLLFIPFLRSRGKSLKHL